MNDNFVLCLGTLCEGIEDDSIKEKVRAAFINSITDACYTCARSVASLSGKDPLFVATQLVNILIH